MTTVLRSAPVCTVSTDDEGILAFLRSLPNPRNISAGKSAAWSREYQPGTGVFEVSELALDAVRRLMGDDSDPLLPLYG